MPTLLPGAVDAPADLGVGVTNDTDQTDTHPAIHDLVGSALAFIEDFLVNGGGHLALGAAPFSAAGALRLSKGDPGVSATGLLSMPVQPTIGDSLTVGAQTFTFVADGTASQQGDIDVGTDAASAQANLVQEWWGWFGNANSQSTIAPFAGDVAVVSAWLPGTDGNALGTSSNFTDVSNGFAAVTLGGGADRAAPNGLRYRNSGDSDDLPGISLESIVYAAKFAGTAPYDVLRIGSDFGSGSLYFDKYGWNGGAALFRTNLDILISGKWEHIFDGTPDDPYQGYTTTLDAGGITMNGPQATAANHNPNAGGVTLLDGGVSAWDTAKRTVSASFFAQMQNALSYYFELQLNRWNGGQLGLRMDQDGFLTYRGGAPVFPDMPTAYPAPQQPNPTGRIWKSGSFLVSGFSDTLQLGADQFAAGILVDVEATTTGDTMQVGTDVYTFVDAPAVAFDIGSQAVPADARAAIVAALNGIDGINAPSAFVSAALGSNPAYVYLTARTIGEAANGDATVYTNSGAGGIGFIDATLTGGSDALAFAAFVADVLTVLLKGLPTSNAGLVTDQLYRDGAGADAALKVV